MKPFMHGDRTIVLAGDEEADRDGDDALLAHLLDHLAAALELARAKHDDVAAAGIRLVLTHLRATHPRAGFGATSNAQ